MIRELIRTGENNLDPGVSRFAPQPPRSGPGLRDPAGAQTAPRGRLRGQGPPPTDRQGCPARGARPQASGQSGQGWGWVEIQVVGPRACVPNHTDSRSFLVCLLKMFKCGRRKEQC